MPRINVPRLIVAALALAHAGIACAQVDLALVEQRYRELVSGRLSISQLTPSELEELRQYVAAITRASGPRRETRAECMRRNATSENPSSLELSVLDLKCSGRTD